MLLQVCPNGPHTREMHPRVPTTVEQIGESVPPQSRPVLPKFTFIPRMTTARTACIPITWTPWWRLCATATPSYRSG